MIPVEAGGTLKGSNGTEITVIGVVEDAWPLIQAENQFNDPPVAGNRFYLINVLVAFPFGTGSINVKESDFSLIGDGRIVYTPHENSCGVIPGELSAELFSGGEILGNACFQIAADEAGMILIHKPLFSFAEGKRRFLSLE